MNQTQFIRAICEKPGDDDLRLIYADWLGEHGNPQREEFIRAQIELAKNPPRPKIVLAGTHAQYMDWLRETGTSAKDAFYVDRTERILGLHNADIVRTGTWWNNKVDELRLSLCEHPLRRRERELLNQNVGSWVEGLPDELITKTCPHCADRAPDWETNTVECGHCDCTGQIPDYDNVDFSRGFVSYVMCTQATWLQYGREVVLTAPIEEVVLDNLEPWTNSTFGTLNNPTGLQRSQEWMVRETYRVSFELFGLLWPTEEVLHTDGNHVACYPNRKAALKDVSRACVHLARARAELQPYEISPDSPTDDPTDS